MHTVRYVSLAALACLAACGSDSASPTVDVNSLVDQSGVATYSSAAVAASVPGAGAVASLPSAGSSSCAYSATDQRFNCAPVTLNGMTITRSYALLDASGQPISTPNPLTIAAIHTITDFKGTMTPTGVTAASLTIDRHEDATLSQLQAAVHILNGTSTQKLVIGTTGSTMTSNETSTTANLQLAQPTAAVHWPLGGTITTDRTISLTGTTTGTPSHEVISFDGTSVMTITTTSAGVTHTCKIDLAKPIVPLACG